MGNRDDLGSLGGISDSDWLQLLGLCADRRNHLVVHLLLLLCNAILMPSTAYFQQRMTLS